MHMCVCVLNRTHPQLDCEKALSIHLMRLLSKTFPRINISFSPGEELYKPTTTRVSWLEGIRMLSNEDPVWGQPKKTALSLGRVSLNIILDLLAVVCFLVDVK